MNEHDTLDPVGDLETLGRITRPDEWDGEHFRPDRLQTQDLMQLARGWSVQRVEGTTLEKAIEVTTSLAIDPAAANVAVASVAEVRSLVDDAAQRLFFVKDDPVLGNECHALVYIRQGMGHGTVRRHKARLIEKLLRKTSLGAVFQPA